MLGDGRFASAGYQMIGTESDPSLQINVRERDYSPPSVRPMLVIDGAQVERVQFMLGARFTFMDLGRYGTEWRNDVILGSEHGLQSEFYFPFGKERRWFLAPRVFAAKSVQDFYREGNLIAEYGTRLAGLRQLSVSNHLAIARYVSDTSRATKSSRPRSQPFPSEH